MRFIYALILPLIACRSLAEAPAPLDAEQRKIIETVTREIVQRIAGLKDKYPELSKKGEAPFFTANFGEFYYHPKGIGIYFRLAATGTPASALNPHYSHGSSGGARAGISHELNLSTGARLALDKEIQQIVGDELATTFERLTAEYLLRKRGVELDVPSLLAAVQSRDAELGDIASTALRFYKLTPEQLASLRQISVSVMVSGHVPSHGVDIIETQDKAHLPDFYRDMVEAAIRAQEAGMDAFEKTPFFGSGWESADIGIRVHVADAIRASGEARFLPVARMLLERDPVARNRLTALEYVAALSCADAEQALLGALENSFRSVQAKAARLAGDKKLTAAKDKLERLLASPSLRVRTNAAAALSALGKPTDGGKERPIPDSGRGISRTLWENGLTDQNILEVCSQPGEFFWLGKGTKPPRPLPKGIRLDGDDLRLDDPWRMSRCDAASIRKRAEQYHAGIGCFFGYFKIDATGPFLLAAALEIKDDDTAALIYDRLCDEFDTDDEALERGMTVLGWQRFLAGLDHYQRKRDRAAITSFHEVVALKHYAKPHGVLGSCVRQSSDLIADIEKRLLEPSAGEPDPSDKEACIAYWVGKIKEINGIMPGQPDSPRIWYEEVKFSDIPQPPFASDKLRAFGLASLPALIDVMNDTSPTRTVGYWRDFHPTRYLVTVGGAARQIFAAICDDFGLLPPELLREKANASRELTSQGVAELGAWVKAIPSDAKRLSKTERGIFVGKHHPFGPFLDAP